MNVRQAVQCLLFSCVSLSSNLLLAEQQQPLFINGGGNGKQILNKTQIASCLQMQEQRAVRDMQTQDSSKKVGDLEKTLLEQEQYLKQQTLQLDKLEQRAKTSALAMEWFREQARRYNRQLEGFNQLKQDYQAAIAEHNTRIAAYNRYCAEYQQSCGGKHYYEHDLKQVQAGQINLVEQQ